jgi:inorganic pyrophosphatase
MDPNLKLDDWIGQSIRVVIDRPLGSPHPDYGFRYEVNYGFLPGLIAPDGEEQDVYLLGTGEPLEVCEAAEVVAIVRRRNDLEDKLVAVVGAETWDAAKIQAAVRFQEQFFDSYVELPETVETDSLTPIRGDA